MEDKAVIQPGLSDIPTVRVQLGRLMNSARIPGGSGPCSPVHKRLLFTFLFFSKCLDVLRAQRSLKPRPSIGQGKPEAGIPRAGTLGPQIPSSVLPASLCHMLGLGVQWVASSWPRLFGKR